MKADLRQVESWKIESAKKFFAALNAENQLSGDDAVHYGVVDSYAKLIQLVS